MPTSGVKSYTLAGDDIPTITDGGPSMAEFMSPCGMATDGKGNLYVADRDGNCIRKIANPGTSPMVSTIAGSRVAGLSDNADPIQAKFYVPQALVADTSGNLYIADTGNNCIRKYDGVTHAVTTIAGGGAGFKDALGTSAQFRQPLGLALDGTKLYVADHDNNRIRMIDLSDSTYPVSTIAGSFAGMQNDPDATKALFNGPYALTVGPDGTLYVLEQLNHRIRSIGPLGTREVKTFAGPDESVTPASGDAIGGANTDARFNFQYGGGMVFDGSGAMFVVDGGNARVKRISGGAVTNYAGDGKVDPATRVEAYVSDAAGLDALKCTYSHPVGIALGETTLYIGDSGNFRVRMLK